MNNGHSDPRSIGLPPCSATYAAEIAAAVAAQMEKHFRVEPTLTLAEAAEQMGIHVTTLRGIIQQGRIPAVHLDGKSYRIRVIDINRYIDECVHSTAAVPGSAPARGNRRAAG